MLKLHYKRKYDKNNRLIHELIDSVETIIKYDINGNIIFMKKWNIENGDVWYEQHQEFDTNNNLIHFKDVENLVEYWIEYDNCNRPKLKRFDNGEYIKFSYDDHGNLLKEEYENDDLTEYENIYED